MIEYKEVDLNINEISRMQQQLDKKKSELIAIIALSVFILLVALLITEGDISAPWIGVPTFIIFFISLFIFSNIKAIETDLENISDDKKENNFMKKIEFETAEKEIKGLISSKEIEYNPLYREKNTPNAHKIILDHTNKYLYYIILDKREKKESIKYHKIPYSEIIQAAVIIDEVIISKSSLASKIGGTVAGGILGGGIGAVVGGTNTKKSSSKEINEVELRIIVNDLQNPSISLRINESPIKKPEKIKNIRNLADEWKTTIDLIIKEENEKIDNTTKTKNRKTVNNNTSRHGDKIQMLKDLSELKTSGAITEEDFNQLKKDVLDS